VVLSEDAIAAEIRRQHEEMEAMLAAFDDKYFAREEAEEDDEPLMPCRNYPAKLDIPGCLRTRSCQWRVQFHVTSVVVCLLDDVVYEQDTFATSGMCVDGDGAANPACPGPLCTSRGDEYLERVRPAKFMAMFVDQRRQMLGLSQTCEDDLDRELAAAIEIAALCTHSP